MNAESVDKYDVKEIQNILTSEECDVVIQCAKKSGLTKSSLLFQSNTKIYTSNNTDNRISSETWLENTYHPILKKISEINTNLTGLPENIQEDLVVVKYNTGGKFNAHYDASDTYNGQRYTTLIIYLNDDFEGGETVFTKIDKTIKPKKGNGILFYNTDVSGKILVDSLHKGNPIIAGEKWICTKWSHSKKFETF
jgi:hypothetical protein